MRRATDKDRIREFLLTGRELDLFTAIQECGTSRPSEYVRQLRIEGYEIETIERRTPQGKRYGVYVIPKHLLHQYGQTELFVTK